MTNLLQQAYAVVSQLPEDEQNEMAVNWDYFYSFNIQNNS